MAFEVVRYGGRGTSRRRIAMKALEVRPRLAFLPAALTFSALVCGLTPRRSTSNRLHCAALAFSALVCGLILALPAHADATAGKNAFSACAACHSVSGAEGAGPHLNGVIGRKAGSVAGFNYSRAFKQANIVWDAGSLDSYIANPQQLIPGNHMPFSGLPDAAPRAAIVAYLATLR